MNFELQKHDDGKSIPLDKTLPLGGAKAVLLTGGLGFIASHLLRYLFFKYPNYTFVNLDALTYCASLDNIPKEISQSNRYMLYVGNIQDKNLVEKILERHRIDTILHLAAETHVCRSFENALEFTMTNVVGTHVLLHCASKSPWLKLFFHVSTDEVISKIEYQHDENGKAVPLKESALVSPSNVYAATKSASECYVRSYGFSAKLPYIIVRPNNVYGPGQYPEKVVPRFIEKAFNRQPVPIHGPGTALRSYLYIDDVIQALDIILHHGQIGETYHVGSDQEHTVLQVYERIASLFDKHSLPPVSKVHVEDRQFQDERYWIDSAKINKLGWRKTVSFDEGLERTLVHFLTTSNKIPQRNPP